MKFLNKNLDAKIKFVDEAYNLEVQNYIVLGLNKYEK